MSLNVLIVDDSAVMRRIVRRCLELSGLPLGEVHEAGNGREGLAMLDRVWVDVVFTDINMPEMNGEEMIMQLRRLPEMRDVAVIVISTEGSETRIGRLNSLGASFIHKPFRPETVRDVVMGVIDQPIGADLDAILARTAERTFADLAFMATADGEPTPPDAQASVGARIHFNGPLAGSLLLFSRESIIPTIALNMLGLEEDETTTAEQQQDALRELVSVICGNVVPALAGPCAIFQLQPPEYLRPEGLDACAADPPAARACLGLEEGTVELRLFLDRAAPPAEVP
jgi:two-component system, chemotaxis family, chemotaxis protein CheY